MAKVRVTEGYQRHWERELKKCNEIIEYAEMYEGSVDCRHCQVSSKILDAKVKGYTRQYEEILGKGIDGLEVQVDEDGRSTVKNADPLTDLINAKVAFARAQICRQLMDLPKNMVESKRTAIANKAIAQEKLKAKPGEILR